MVVDRDGIKNGYFQRMAEESMRDTDIVPLSTDIIWAREMLTGSYAPRWAHLKDETTGERFRGIAFVMRRDCDRYAGHLDPEETANRIAHAHGKIGPCREYLEKTVLALDELGIGDGPMHDLLRRVRRIAHKDVAEEKEAAE